MPDPKEQLDALYTRLLGIFYDALAAKTEPTHGGDHAKRDIANGERFELFIGRLKRLHEAYADFARDQVKGAKK